MSPAATSALAPHPRTVGSATDPVGLSWLVTVRWATILAGAGAVIAGASALQVSAPLPLAITALAAAAASNAWLARQVHRERTGTVATIAGALLCADVLLLSWLLLRSGGTLNPASVFLLVQIVVSALVLGRRWTWVVTALAVGSYAALFLAPADELVAAQAMHPEITLHMRGMWLAFALTALIIGTLVTRLVIAIERRDSALEDFRDLTARATRAAGLATLAAGAAHELSTPLATIAVAAHELEQNVTGGRPNAELQRDARLIRSETERCRNILNEMAGRSGQPVGELPIEVPLTAVADAATARLSAVERERIVVDAADDVRVVWPTQVVARALENLLRNGLQASTADDPVRLVMCRGEAARIRIDIIDRGSGVAPGDVARIGEPFFTTKAAHGGTGLGMFVARTSFEQLGGSLTIAPRAAGGTTVTVTLPENVIEHDSARV